MQEEPLHLLITGPTAVGKTEYINKIAEAENLDIISADSIQIYRGMDIGSAKPDSTTLKKIKHHLIDIVNPDEIFGLSEFLTQTKELLNEYSNNNQKVIISGGTGLFIKALRQNFSLPQTIRDDKFRNRLTKEAEEFGGEILHKRLKEKDPEAATRIFPNDIYRLVRALEVFELTGKAITGLQDQEEIPRTDIKTICLLRPREVLYERCNLRVEQMLESGLIQEVDSLLKKGYSKDLASMKAVGYKEIIPYLDGEYDYTTMKETLQRNTRRLVKKQLTWFRSFKDMEIINLV